MLGFPHPDYLLPYLSASQYEDWLAWLKRFFPFPHRDDLHWGNLLCLIANQWADEGDRTRPEDWMPYHDRFEEDVTAEELLARLGI